MRGKKGADFLTENVVFIVITILFIGALFVFISRTSSTTSKIEEIQAKKLALIIDSARPGTNILLNVEDILKSKSESFDTENVFTVNGNTLNVKLSEKSGQFYSFFNDVDVKLDIYEKGEGRFLNIVIKKKD